MAYNLIFGDYKITNDPMNIIVSKRVYTNDKPTEKFGGPSYYPTLTQALLAVKRLYERSDKNVVNDVQSFIQLETSFQSMFNQQLNALELAAQANGTSINSQR